VTQERIYDFGSGTNSGNFHLARKSTSNDLSLYANWGRGSAAAALNLAGFIQQNQTVVSVAT
jgi:hypothetical protein